MLIHLSFTYYPDRKVQTIKDLEKPWAALTPRVLRPAPPTLPSARSSPKWTGHSAATTLLLDDSHAKAALQPHNHLCIPEYTRTQRNADLAVLQLEHAMQQQKQQQESSTVSHQEGTSSTPGPGRDATTNTRTHERAVSSPDGTSTTTDIEQADNKRKRKKTKKKRDKALQQLAAIPDDGASPAAVFDETLLAVIGILHAARLQCSIAGWLRAGALFHPPPLLSEPERRAAAGVDGGGDAEAVKTWCDDPVLVRSWASRGREAMHELGLKVEHGVES